MSGIKDIENRTWRNTDPARIYFHACANYPYVNLTDEQEDLIRGDFRYNFIKRKFQTSAIIGEVDIIDRIQYSDSIWAERPCTEVPKIFHWVLANPVKYDQPLLNVKGKLNLWEY